jgi:hypothetical protein
MELRRFTRAPIRQQLLFTPRDDEAFSDGVARDICLGGMFIETEFPAPFNAEVVVHIRLDETGSEIVLPGIVRWTDAEGMGVQFQLLGVRETFAITEIVRRYEEAGRGDAARG